MAKQKLQFYSRSLVFYADKTTFSYGRQVVRGTLHVHVYIKTCINSLPKSSSVLSRGYLCQNCTLQKFIPKQLFLTIYMY